LTKKEVAALLAGNATDRPDLEQELSSPVLPITLKTNEVERWGGFASLVALRTGAREYIIAPTEIHPEPMCYRIESYPCVVR
jgi:hypothetical protein